jgi:hypothetical protein
MKWFLSLLRDCLKMALITPVALCIVLWDCLFGEPPAWMGPNARSRTALTPLEEWERIRPMPFGVDN